MEIRADDLAGEATQALVRLHLAEMRANSPPGHAFALDFGGLQEPGVTFWSAWSGEEILGMAALKQIDAGQGEVKSMRTHPLHLRRGVASALLDHIIADAGGRGLRRLSLETGSGPAFDPALALYRARGFTAGEAFGAYRPSAFNQFLHLSLLGALKP